MTGVRLALVVGLLSLATGCAKPRVAPAPTRADLVVLLPDPEDGRIGAATVTSSAGAVELTTANDATRVVAGQAPSAPAPMTADDIQRVFGDAISARPLAPREFLLYFETGGDTLTPESEALLATIVEFVRGRPAPDVSVIGHTDTLGDARDNYELGLRRATLIRDQLVKSGLDAAQVDISSHGEADLLLRTADNTDEPKNRRVEVTVR